jgi:hypothetical protein
MRDHLLQEREELPFIGTGPDQEVKEERSPGHQAIQEIHAMLQEAEELFTVLPSAPHFSVVTEAAPGKQAPLERILQLLGDAQKELADAEILSVRGSIIGVLQGRIEAIKAQVRIAEETNWWGERLNAFSHGGIYNPTLDKLRPNRP